ncbi:hypothetical protein RF11_14805 [Thelohanellus kitauei]|uniref:CCHC-type domain-containing protein n=1 Tax=Thelohanellus kitauei TaxID=669202 RepID=A0A0C2J2I4_THEKT|nr:hypothetical protein RF11_14805 [Thelohanellus kitauei]
MSTQFGSRKFVVRERHRFYTELSRKSNETVRELAERVREKGLTCDFPSISDPLGGFEDGIHLHAVFHKSSDDLTYAQVVEIAAEVKDTSHTAKKQMSNHTEGVDKISRPARDVREKNNDAMGPCFNCGKRGHFRQQCRLRDSVCRYCNMKGHIEAVCSRKFNKNRFVYEEESVGNVVSSIKERRKGVLRIHIVNPVYFSVNNNFP